MTSVIVSQGEAWDQLAYRIWGDEKLMHKLLEANPEYRETVFFSGGEILAVPDVDAAQPAVDLPPWKRGAA